MLLSLLSSYQMIVGNGVSEYKDLSKYGFIKIFEIEKRQLLNKNSDTKTNAEYLFWNGKK